MPQGLTKGSSESSETDSGSPASVLELRHLRAFVAVAQELHFTRAAQRLHLAQQALSSQIKQLEDSLGAQLFRRTTRVVELTSAGEALLARAPKILSMVDEAWTATRRVVSEEREQLRIAYTPSVGSVTLPFVTEALHENCPSIRVMAHEFWLQEAMHVVADGSYDAAFVRCPRIDNDEVEVRLVRTEPLGVILGVGHRAARAELIHPDQLAESTLAIWPREHSPQFYDLVVEAFPRNAEEGRIYEFENFSRQGFVGDTVAKMEIAAGRAFSVRFGDWAEAPPEGFLFRPLEPAPSIGLHIVYRRDRITPPLSSLIQVTRDVAVAEGWLPEGPAQGALPKVA